MSTIGKITLNVRHDTGKNAANRARAAGLIPAVVYGQGKAQVAITVNPADLRKAMDPARKFNTVFEASLVENGKEIGSEKCMIVDYQLNPVRDEMLHVDFLRVTENAEVVVTIPVNYTGKPIGVTAGGKLRTFRRSVKVSAKPSELPATLDLDLTNLGGGEALRFKDISVPGARVLEAPQTVAALVEVPRAEKAAASAEPAKKGKK
jgi:large subunit ribosomal protein L25